MTENTNNSQAVFDEAIAAGMDKDATIILLNEKAGLSIVQAVSTYNKLGKAAGIILSGDEKTAKITELLSGFNTDAGFDREGAKTSLMDEFGFTSNTANSHIKTYCTANGIELPKAITAKASPDKVDALVKSMHEAGNTRQEILEAIETTFEYKKNTCSSVYSKSAKRLNIAMTGGTSESRAKLIDYFVQYGESVDRKTMIEALKSNFGLAEATANSYYSNYTFAMAFYKAKTGAPVAEAEAQATDAEQAA